METKLLQLKTDFNNIINIRTKVKGIFDILQSKISKLKGLYAEFIKTSKTQMYIFGLDSFHFQSKLIDMEYDDMKRLFLAISNRMYCEYFKLYKIITEYIMSNKNDKTLSNVKINSYPIYKDLEPYKEYDFETIQYIHENILDLVGVLISTLNNKENEILLHKNKQSIGLNIDNFITSFNYSINIMKEKIIMFITYIEFFHKLHTKYLKRFSNRIQLMYSYINHDINFDDVNKSNSDDSTDSLKNSDEENDSSSESKYIQQDNSSESDHYSNSSGLSFEKDAIRSRTNSSVSSNNTQAISPKFNLKNNNKIDIDETISHEDVNNIFSTIDMSCDNILNKNKNNSKSSENLTINNTNAIVQANIVETSNDKEYESNISIYLLEPPIDT
jgi:hypothetical protein